MNINICEEDLIQYSVCWSSNLYTLSFTLQGGRVANSNNPCFRNCPIWSDWIRSDCVGHNPWLSFEPSSKGQYSGQNIYPCLFLLSVYPCTPVSLDGFVSRVLSVKRKFHFLRKHNVDVTKNNKLNMNNMNKLGIHFM